ncbi:unnamed protein product [Phaeothamnion confervicola]
MQSYGTISVENEDRQQFLVSEAEAVVKCRGSCSWVEGALQGTSKQPRKRMALRFMFFPVLALVFTAAVLTSRAFSASGDSSVVRRSPPGGTAGHSNPRAGDVSNATTSDGGARGGSGDGSTSDAKGGGNNAGAGDGGRAAAGDDGGGGGGGSGGAGKNTASGKKPQTYITGETAATAVGLGVRSA